MEPEEFLKAAARGKVEVVERFLEDGGDPNTCDEVQYVGNYSTCSVQWYFIYLYLFKSTQSFKTK